MEDHIFIEDLQHTNRGRIPERIFHAKGIGAHGYFEVTHDITKYCAAKIFCEVGKRTPQFTRFSLGISHFGLADTIQRGLRGVATKFYTEEGNWDLTCVSEPVLAANDPLMPLNGANAFFNDPQRNWPVLENAWDWVTLFPESVHFMLITSTDRGIPDGYRHMNSFAINTYKLINRHGEAVYARFTWITEQGIKNIDPLRAVQLAGSNPDHYDQDLVEAINRGDYPWFKLCIQVMTFEEAEKLPFNPFSASKVWPHKQFPLIPVGRMVMNRNTANHHDETEQSAFWPGNLVPGIRASPDKNLTGRFMIYKDNHVHRLGVNYQQIPINQPLKRVTNYQREGRGVYVSQGSAPNYFPNSFGGPVESQEAQELDPSYRECGDVARHDEDPDYYSQPREFWRNVLNDVEKQRTIFNIALTVRQVSIPLQKRTIALFGKVDQDIANRLEEELRKPAPQ